MRSIITVNSGRAREKEIEEKRERGKKGGKSAKVYFRFADELRSSVGFRLKS